MGQMSLDENFRHIVRDENDALFEKLRTLIAGDARRPARAVVAVPNDEPNRYLTFREAAVFMGVSRRTVGRRVKSGHLRASGPRNDRIAKFEIDRYMREGPDDGGDDDVLRVVNGMLGKK